MGETETEHRARLGFAVALTALAVDQVHKWWMLSVVGMTLGERFDLTPFLEIYYVLNKGISYGLFEQDGSGQVLLSAFAGVVAILLGGWLVRAPHTRSTAAGIGLVMGGAVGNGIDRLHLGGVADFFNLHAFGYNWYIFNLADVAIVAGVAALVYDSFRSSRRDRDRNDAPKLP